MADAGDLEKLPAELRNEIYAIVLVRPDEFELQNYQGFQVAPRYHHRDRKHRNEKWDYRTGKWSEVPSNVALLCANKKVYAEAGSVLYGGNKFVLHNVKTLQRFLHPIAESMKQEIRHVTIETNGGVWQRAGPQVRRSMRALAKAKGLRTLEVSRREFEDWDRREFLEQLVKSCKPLLDALKESRETNDTAASVLDVIKFTPPQLTVPGVDQSFGKTGRSSSYEERLRCAELEHASAKEEDKVLVRALRREVARQIGMAYD